MKPFPLRCLRRQQCKQGRYRAMRCRLGSPQAVACAPCKSCAGPFSPPVLWRLSADSFLANLFENGGAVLQDSAPYWGPTAPAWQAAHFERLLSLQVPARKQHPHPVLLDLWRRRPSRARGWTLPLALPQPAALCFLQLRYPLLRAMPLESRCPCSVRLSRRRCHSVPGLLPVLEPDLLVHLRAASALVQPGAGSAASLPPNLRLKHVRRWALAFIRRRNVASVPLVQAELSREEPAAEPSLVARLLLLAARALCAEGLARLEEDFLHPLPVREQNDVFPQLQLLVILLMASGQVPRSRLGRDSIVWGRKLFWPRPHFLG